jgi:purine-binding chemotaxis protein CheW
MTGDPDVEAVLAERARRLARPLPDLEPRPGAEVLVIEAGGERFAVDLAWVERVHPVAEVAPLPGLRPPWRGLVSVRGELLPALDLPAYLGRPPEPATGVAVSCAVVAAGGLRVALLSEVAPGVGPRPAEVVDVAGILADPALVVDDEPRGRSG